MTAPALVQTRCPRCDHSAAAHENGPCVGIDVVSSATGRRRIRAITVCDCPGLPKVTYTVPAAMPRRMSA